MLRILLVLLFAGLMVVALACSNLVEAFDDDMGSNDEYAEGYGSGEGDAMHDAGNYDGDMMDSYGPDGGKSDAWDSGYAAGTVDTVNEINAPDEGEHGDDDSGNDGGSDDGDNEDEG